MDILIVAVLCIVNARIAKKKGRKAGGYIAVTIALTLGLIFVFTAVVLAKKMPGLMSSGNITPDNALEVFMTELGGPVATGTYIALAIGGITSVLITLAAKKGEQIPPNAGVQNSFAGSTYPQNNLPRGMYDNSAFSGNTYPDEVQGEILAAPCTVCLVREPGGSGANDIYTFSLNGHPVCQLPGASYYRVMTNVAQNTVTARDGAGISLKKPVQFTAVSGGYVEIHARGGQFLPEKTVGMAPQGSAPAPENKEEKSAFDEL